MEKTRLRQLRFIISDFPTIPRQWQIKQCHHHKHAKDNAYFLNNIYYRMFTPIIIHNYFFMSNIKKFIRQLLYYSSQKDFYKLQSTSINILDFAISFLISLAISFAR